jgi:hypothetical protein
LSSLRACEAIQMTTSGSSKTASGLLRKLAMTTSGWS